MRSIIPLVFLSIFIIACNSTGTQRVESSKKSTSMDNLKSIAKQAQTAFFKTYNEADMRTYFTENYIQHNPHVPTGLTPVLEILPTLKKAGLTCTTHRMLQDGDFIVMHNTYDNAEVFGAKEMIAFDVWRMENGKVAEHWDGLTTVVAETASGRSQTDGSTTITDLEKTAENKALVKNFVTDVLVEGQTDKIPEYVSATQYDQHNPMVKDGLAGLNEAIQHLVSINDMFVYKKLHRVFGEGNFVVTQSEGEWHGKPQVFYDLFRVDAGKIVEHWDVIQEIPAEMAHANGMF
ncbi:MAG: nuclear transport factor 2 family protein [Flammeovirgaceae bacterium]